MKNSKKFLIGCAALAVAGVVLSAAGVAMGGIVYNVRLGVDGLHVSSPALQEKEKSKFYEKKETVEAFQSMDIDLGYADVRVEASKEKEYKVEYALPKTRDLEYGVSDGRLVLKSTHRGGIIIGDVSFFSIGRDPQELGETPGVVIYVPKDARFTKMNIKTESGSVRCQDISADSAKLVAAYGDIELRNARFRQLDTGQESGNLYLEQVQGEDCKIKNEYGNIAVKDASFQGDMNVKLESGDMNCQSVGVRDLTLENEYGKVSGQQIKLRNMKASLESGSCILDELSLEQCKIKSEYGDVELGLLSPLSEYGFDLKAEYGEIRMDGENMGETYRSIEQGKAKNIVIHNESGDIKLR